MEVIKPREILDDKYVMKKKIGYGAQGKIYLVENIDNKDEVVVKLREKEDLLDIEKHFFLNEIEILKKLRNEEKKHVPYIYDSGEGYIKKEGINEDNLKKNLYLIMDYASKGDLFNYIKKNPTGFGELHGKLLFKKIVEGIKYCHDNNICHLDIKLANILLGNNYCPKITDFGLSQEITNDVIKEKKKFVGTLQYMCPQILSKEPYFGIEADIFSLGVVLFNIVTGKYGFKLSLKNDNYYSYVAARSYKSYWDKLSSIIPNVSNYSDEFKDLYIRMISFKPERRPRINEILNHPWFKEINDMSEEELSKLEVEIMEEFLALEEKKNKDNESIHSNQNTDYTDNASNRGISLEKLFNNSIEIKRINKGDKFANNYLKINGINPVDFMNLLVNYINKKYEQTCNIEMSDKKLQFEVNFEIKLEYDNDEHEKLEENEEIEEQKKFEKLEEEYNNNCYIKIKMYEDTEGGYLLNFIKMKGDIDNYYKYFLEIKDMVKELLN